VPTPKYLRFKRCNATIGRIIAARQRKIFLFGYSRGPWPQRVRSKNDPVAVGAEDAGLAGPDPRSHDRVLGVLPNNELRRSTGLSPVGTRLPWVHLSESPESSFAGITAYSPGPACHLFAKWDHFAAFDGLQQRRARRSSKCSVPSDRRGLRIAVAHRRRGLAAGLPRGGTHRKRASPPPRSSARHFIDS